MQQPKRVYYIPRGYQRRRFACGIFMACAICLIFVFFVLYNYNAVMILFDRGNVRLSTEENLMNKLDVSAEKYTILDKTTASTSEDGMSHITFQTTDEFALISAACDEDGQIVEVTGTLYLRRFQASGGVVGSLVIINDILSPIIHPRDILAFEMLVLQETYQLSDLNRDISIEKDLGEMALSLEKAKGIESIIFSIGRK